jgi:hypothetical protein
MKSLAKIIMFSIYALGLSMVSTQTMASIVLGLTPSSQSAVSGDNISLNLTISGLGNGVAPSLGDFDIDLGFDTTKLSFSSYTLGASLGDLSLSEAADFSLGGIGGLINLSEVSLLSASALETLQSSSFTLATLLFHVDSLLTGQSTVVAFDSVNALGDGNGSPLGVEIKRNATISNGARVPEPGVLLLVMLGLLIIHNLNNKAEAAQA